MARNKIYCAACQDALKYVDDDSIDLIIIDPPYLTTREAWDKEEVFNSNIVRELHRILKSTGNIYVWCGIGEKSQSLMRWFPILQECFHFKDLITWKKRRGIGMRKGWLYVREEILWFVKDNKQFTWNKKEQYNESEPNLFTKGFSGYAVLSKYKRFTNVWTDIPEILRSKGIAHFTPKPVQAIERIIQLHTQKGDVVLDCYAGSGTTGVACKKLGRDYILIEIVLEFCKLSRRIIDDTEEE